jgi:hypothetical protein
LHLSQAEFWLTQVLQVLAVVSVPLTKKAVSWQAVQVAD